MEGVGEDSSGLDDDAAAQHLRLAGQPVSAWREVVLQYLVLKYRRRGQMFMARDDPRQAGTAFAFAAAVGGTVTVTPIS